MKVQSAITAICLIAWVSACSPIYGVNHDYDPKIDFSSLKTYQWHLLLVAT